MAESFTAAHVNGMIDAAMTGYDGCVIGLFDGTKPVSAEDSEGSANLLCLITKDGGEFTPGVATNGLTWAGPDDGVMRKPEEETWSGLGLAAAGSSGKTATWFRVYDNSYTTGKSSDTWRWDGSITTTSMNEMKMSSRLVVEGIPTTIKSFSLTLLKS